MKFLPLIMLAALMATGCMPRQPSTAVLEQTEQQRLFFHYLDAATASERDQALQRLQQDFPQSPMTDRAVLLATQDQSLREQQAKNKKLTAELQRCRDESTQQKTDNIALRHDLEQLKELLIEMETRSR